MSIRRAGGAPQASKVDTLAMRMRGLPVYGYFYARHRPIDRVLEVRVGVTYAYLWIPEQMCLV